MAPSARHTSYSPDPIDFLSDHARKTPPRTEPAENVDLDPSPAVRPPNWGPIPRFPSETPSEAADRSLTANSELSHHNPEDGHSPPVRLSWGPRTTVQNEDEDDYPNDTVSASEVSDGHPSEPGAPYIEDDDADYDPQDTLSYGSLHDDHSPRAPGSNSPDGVVFTLLELESDEPSAPEHEFPIPTDQPVFHDERVGAVVVPFRDEPEFPQRLLDAEETLASQIASALTNPRSEGLNSETFQTLLETFLYPRINGRNSNGERFKLHQYSQLQAVAISVRGAQSTSAPGKRKRNRLDPDPKTHDFIEAVKERRVPDMTTMAIFEKKVPIPDSRGYQLQARRGPKLCITEIKSINWNGDPEILESALEIPMSKAHYQNYVAAQYLFREDKHLQHVASFAGAAHVWSFSEFHRSQYPLLYERPLPVTEKQASEWEESEAVESPRKPVRPSKRAKRSRSSLASAVEGEAGCSNTAPQDGELHDKVEEKSDYPEYLHWFPNMPPTDTPLDEIFRRYEQPVDDLRVERRKPVSFLPILDPDARTFEAFDVIVERMRGWYAPSNRNTDLDHQLVFDDDPYEYGTCPATVARKQSEQ